MTKIITKTIDVGVGVNKYFLANTLTRDISVLESIFDLIDNSIDAARDHLISKNYERDIYGLPADYSAYKINIRIGRKSISILDNCLGMDEETLSLHAFKTAESSNHKYGIGYYGLGLKRALLKFGNKFAMSSDNGNIAFKMHFDNAMISGNEKLVANAYDSSGHRKTLFIVSDIKHDIQYEIQTLSWFENAVKMLRVRYAAYTAKGLKISISNSFFGKFYRADGLLPAVRSNSKFTPVNKCMLINGVSIYIDSGVHEKYYFPAESGHSLAINKTLTDDFGLYFICNDRVIVSSSVASEHGWKTKWHSEYNGFVCMVRFVSEDPEKMPWNTLKTALKTDASLFVEVRDNLQPIADLYRQSVKKLYPPPGAKNPSDSSSDRNSHNDSAVSAAHDHVNSSVESKVSKRNSASSAANNRHMHPTNWDTLLPKEFPLSSDEVLNAFIVESTTLKCDTCPCSSALLLRSILEKALRQYVYKTQNFETVKAHFYASSEGMKKNHSEEYKKNQGLELSMMANWLSDQDVARKMFGSQKFKELALATKQSKKHVQKLNGIVHGIEFIDSGHLRIIRNEIYPLLKFCVTNA